MYRYLEEMTLNTWPAIENLISNGWVIRSSEGFTKRANSVSPLYSSDPVDAEAQIRFCEKHFTNLEQDTVFKITPYIQPPNLDQILENQGYALIDKSSVQVMELAAAPEPAVAAQYEPAINEAWLEALVYCDGLSETNRSIIRRMLQFSTLQQGFFIICQDGHPAACGLGVIQNEFVALYDIITHPDYRRRGFGMQIVLNILSWAKTEGATHSCLQVVQQNEAAMRLYGKIGYQEIYPYWYRVKKHSGEAQI
ncbi:MAG: hypothetical protein K0R57_2366 [Paenibacillaceae bacterium]|jgi:GNAT superfamily N-acetyltransferase|nr:hypothetical protein [Paenibacillaceae bacterium]